MEVILLDLDGFQAAIPADDTSWLAEELSSHGADGMAAAIRLEDALERGVGSVSLDVHGSRAVLSVLGDHYDELTEPLRVLHSELEAELAEP